MAEAKRPPPWPEGERFGKVVAGKHDASEHTLRDEEPQSAWLAAEFLSAVEAADRPAAVRRLRDLGIGLIDIMREYVGVARVTTQPDGTFVPDPEGDPHIITLAAVALPHMGWGEVFDLVAFKSTAPHVWWRRIGQADTLGDDAIEYAACTRKPLVLHETPLAWLRAGAEGAVVLDWTMNPRIVFSAVTEIHCTTPALAATLQKRFAEVSRPWQTIKVQEGRRNAA